MKFFRRLSNSLFTPTEVVSYHQDPWYITLLYFLLLTFISILPFSIRTLMRDEINYETKQEIKSVFSGSEIPFYINDGTLYKKGEKNTVVKNVGQMKIVFTVEDEFDSELVLDQAVLVFHNDGVYFQQSLVRHKIFGYEEYATQLTDFDLERSGDYSDVQFWNIAFEIANSEFKKLKPTLNVVSIVVLFLNTGFTIFLMSLFFSFFQSLQVARFMKFTKVWKLCIYLLTPYVLGTVLANLFAFELLYYIGLIASAIYMMRLGRTIAMNSMGGKK